MHLLIVIAQEVPIQVRVGLVGYLANQLVFELEFIWELVNQLSYTVEELQKDLGLLLRTWVINTLR